MSRNTRQKFPRVAAAKPPKRRGSDSSSSSLDPSDDEGYSAVDEISESDDDDEEHVYAAEEEHIISHAAHRVHRSLPPQQDAEEDADEEDDDEEETDDHEQAVEEVEQDDDDEEDDDDEVASWDGILSEPDDGAASDFAANYLLDPNVANVERHVRFTGVPDSDSDSTTTDTSEDGAGFFPDIFVEQASLDPAFRREIEYDPDESSNSGGSFWDFGSQDQPDADSDDEVAADRDLDDDTPTATPRASQAPSEVSTPVASSVVQELDGYETDGDTTEEDIPEPPVRRKQVRRVQSVDPSSDSDTERPAHRKRGQPRLGRYNLDSSDRKPVAVLNPISRKMMIFTPQRMRRLDLSPESFNLDFFNAPIGQSSPILSNSASLMMSAMFSSNTFGDFVNTQAVGPAEAFFSLTSDAVTPDDSSETGADDAEDEEERNLKLEDFITFHPDDSDEEGQDEANWDADNTDAASTPGRPRTAASQASDAASPADVHPLLNHFDNNSNAVGAFRRNQINQQLILSDRASHESLAFSGPYHYGTLRGIKSGSLETVTAPITPLRRHRKGAAHHASAFGDFNKSPLESMSQKRKASAALGSDPFHKRHRSISDMEILHL